MVGDFLHHRCHVGYHIVNLQHNWLGYHIEQNCGKQMIHICYVLWGMGLGWGWQGGWLAGVTLLQLLNHIWDEVPPQWMTETLPKNRKRQHFIISQKIFFLFRIGLDPIDQRF